MNAWLLFAQSAAAMAAGETVRLRPTFRFAKLQPYAEAPWFYIGLLVVGIALAAYVIWLYRRDAVELKPGLGPFLAALRLGALLAALFFFLDLQKRSEQEVVRNSRVLVLIDTSQSMAEVDSSDSPIPAAPSRIDQVVAELSTGSLLGDLRKTHDVVVMRFDRDSSRVVSLDKLPPVAASPVAADATAVNFETTKTAQTPFDWKTALLPQGPETRIGSALRRVILEERGSPISAVIVVSDGGQNAGVEPAVVTELAAEAQIPVYTVGLGSDRRPASLRIADLVAPSRAFPGDSFTLTGFVQANHYAKSWVTVELYSRNANERKPAGEAERREAGRLEASQRVTLGADGELIPVKFELKSEKPGRRTYQLRLADVADDHNAADNRQEADVEVVDRKTRVLLLASGATREYRFLASQLRRDKDVIVNVLLQGAAEGISQDAHQILYEFPSTKEELYKYDCLVAFDVDWKNLHSATAGTSELIDLLEMWIGEEAGGLIVVAGPIHTDEWSRLDDLAKLRNLHPVTFERRRAQLTDAKFGSTTPLAVQFTTEGTAAEFLWIEDAAAQSAGAWAEFPGVYGYFDVKGAKPGATVYANLADAATQREVPYLVGHLYGAGRVFYLGSGEMWRLRELDEAYFERFYTKLVRNVSQGRLLRGSARGVLLVERDRYSPGETVVVRAQLSDAQHEPLTAPNITLQIAQPDTTTKAVVLAADPNRKGMYAGQFTVLQEGGYRLELPVPDSVDDQLSRRIVVRGSNPERENTERNNALLSEIAVGTGGVYYRGLNAIDGADGLPALVPQLRDRTETTTLAGAPDEAFERRQMKWLLGILCGCLCLEWLIRRLSKLA